MYDLLILGNGAIGLFFANTLIKRGLDKKLKIGIVGEPTRKWGATMAAGAMHAVFAELEEFQNGSLEQHLFELGLQSRSTFEEIFGKAQHIKTADKTYVYLKRNASEFETRNFQTVMRVSDEHGVRVKIGNDTASEIFGEHANTHEEIICLNNEYGFDARALVNYLSAQIDHSQIDTLDAEIEALNQEDSLISVKTSTGYYKAKKVVNALGSRSNTIMPSDLQSIKQYQGVGTAFIIKKHELASAQKEAVIRTVNRGGAQCGIHVVPLERGFYVGAGNYLAAPGGPELRLDTLRYLLDMASSEILPQKLTYEMTGSVVQGNRPRSLDGLPILGESSDDRVVFATGFNRVALTCAPAISNLLADWLISGKAAFEKYRSWQPDRKPTSYPSSKQEFVISRVSNAIEHSLIENQPDQIAIKVKELEEFYDRASIRIKKYLGFGKDFQIHPDMCGLLLNEINDDTK